MTIYEATLDRPVICLLGENRVYTIGDIAYRFARPQPFPNGMNQTLPRFAKGIPVMFVNDEWRETQLGKPVIRNWTEKVTVLD